MTHSHSSPGSLNEVIIDTSALETNFRILQQRVGQDIQIMAMIKADAYGHGMVRAARSFARAGCTSFAVAEIGEGVQLRQAGIEGRIFVLLGHQDAEAQLFFDYDLTPVVFAHRALAVLSQVALRNGRKIAVRHGPAGIHAR
ncbi:MAG: alanine racemase [Rhodoferax sp.]|nr:alanine racemase [Rhodoferax sp.]